MANKGDVLSTAAEKTIERPPWWSRHIRYTLIDALSYTVGLCVIVWYIDWWRCERSHCFCCRLYRMWKESPLLWVTLGTFFGIYQFLIGKFIYGLRQVRHGRMYKLWHLLFPKPLYYSHQVVHCRKQSIRHCFWGQEWILKFHIQANMDKKLLKCSEKMYFKHLQLHYKWQFSYWFQGEYLTFILIFFVCVCLCHAIYLFIFNVTIGLVKVSQNTLAPHRL